MIKSGSAKLSAMKRNGVYYLLAPDIQKVEATYVIPEYLGEIERGSIVLSPL